MPRSISLRGLPDSSLVFFLCDSSFNFYVIISKIIMYDCIKGNWKKKILKKNLQMKCTGFKQWFILRMDCLTRMFRQHTNMFKGAENFYLFGNVGTSYFRDFLRGTLLREKVSSAILVDRVTWPLKLEVTARLVVSRDAWKQECL